MTIIFPFLLLPLAGFALEPLQWRAFEQVDMGLTLEGALRDLGNSSSCLTKLKSLESFANPTESIGFFDSLGKPASGLTRNLWGLPLLGSYDQCMGMRNSSSGYYEWCSARFQVDAKLGAIPVSTPVHWTMCLPLECREGNLTSAVDSLFKQVATLTKGLLKPHSYKQVCNCEDSYTAGAYLGMILAGLFVGLVALSSIYRALRPVLDSLLEPSSPGDKTVLVSEDGIQTTNSGNAASHIPPSFLEKFVRCFALQDTMADLTNTETKKAQILCLNGIRVLSINWVVLGHTYMYFLGQSGDLGYVGELFFRRSFETVINALPSVDSFFVMSGFLVSYLLLRQLTKKGHLTPLEWIMYYVHRYIRLTVPYLMVILIEGFCYQVWFTGPQRGDIQGIPGCHKSWWTNLLYIQNLYPWKIDANASCVGQAWYLANDMQFYVLAPLFIVPLFYKPLLGGLVTVGSVCASAIAAAVIAYHYHLGPTTVTDVNPDDFWLLYDKPWIRITPYLVGIAGGWFYWAWGEHLTKKIRSTPKYIRVTVAVPIWIVTCAVEYAVVYGLHHDISLRFQLKPVPRVDGTAYQSLARIGWALALTAQILLCQCSLGGFINSLLSWKGWLVLSRLTYPVYLVHLGLLAIINLQMRGAFFFQPAFQMASFYLGILFISYLWGAVLHLAVELPVAKLEKILYR